MKQEVFYVLMEVWEDVSRVWVADAKISYYNKIYNKLLDSSEKIKNNNEDLEEFSKEIIKKTGF